MEIYNVACKRCGASRSGNLKEPCPLCGSREIPLLGYTYGLERTQVTVAALIIIALLIIALVVGALYILYRNFQIQTGYLPTDLHFEMLNLFL